MGESGNTHRPKGGVLVPGHRHVLGGSTQCLSHWNAAGPHSAKGGVLVPGHRHVLGGSTQGKGTGIVNAAGPHKGQRGGGHHGVLTTVSLVAVGKTALLPR